MPVFKTLKGVNKTDILGAVIEHNEHVVFYGKNIMSTCFKLNKGEKRQNKKYITQGSHSP